MQKYLMFVCCIVIAAAPAMAKDHPHKGSPGGPKYHDARSQDYGDKILISLDDQKAIRAYYGRHDFCPPGLAKKNPNCMPPGQYKKYGRGDIIPDSVMYYPLPHDLLLHLHPTPMGTRYVMVDRNVYLIAEGTKKVLDAMVLFSGAQ